LSGKSSSFDQTFSTLGLRAQSEFELDNGTKITARGAVGWRRAFNAQTPKAKLNFAGGNVFDIAGVPMTRDSLVLEAGLDAKVSKSMTIGASYVGQISGSQQAHGFKASLNWKF
jgi:outer membrane autotransporter protein